MTQGRWGKIKSIHSHVLEFEYAGSNSDAARSSIGLVKADGTISAVNPDIGAVNSSGLIILGKYQYVRARLLTLESVTLQEVALGQTVAVYDNYSVTGASLASSTKVAGYDVSGYETQRTFRFHATGIHHTIQISGGFALSSLLLTFHNNGKR
jgi:hypothetical protein